MRKTLFLAGLILFIFSGGVFSQNSPFFIWGNGLDGSLYQTTAIYSQSPSGLAIEAPKDASGNRLPIKFNWRGGGTPPFYICGNGNIGIGSIVPKRKLDVFHMVHNELQIRCSTQDNRFWELGRNALGGHFQIMDETSTIQFHIDRLGGNIGIGTTETGTHKLAVEGTIGAREIKVEADTWSDFVFNDNYKLKALEEVESFIEENNHLPDVPSEKEVLENGIALGEMNAKLLQKIEELTLYMIEMNKEVKALKNENEILKEEINTLKTQ